MIESWSGNRVAASIETAILPISVSDAEGVRTSRYTGRPATTAVVSTDTSAYGATPSSAAAASVDGSSAWASVPPALPPRIGASHARCVPASPCFDRCTARMPFESQSHASVAFATATCSPKSLRCATRTPSADRHTL